MYIDVEENRAKYSHSLTHLRGTKTVWHCTPAHRALKIISSCQIDPALTHETDFPGSLAAHLGAISAWYFDEATDEEIFHFNACINWSTWFGKYQSKGPMVSFGFAIKDIDKSKLLASSELFLKEPKLMSKKFVPFVEWFYQGSLKLRALNQVLIAEPGTLNFVSLKLEHGLASQITDYAEQWSQKHEVEAASDPDRFDLGEALAAARKMQPSL